MFLFTFLKILYNFEIPKRQGNTGPNELFDLAQYDDFTLGHCINVTFIGLMFFLRDRRARKEEVTDLGMGLLLHDIGKKRIDKEILSCPSDLLSSKESEHLKKHVDVGVNMLRSVKGLIKKGVKDLIASHHENYDGTGYPLGLRGEDIHLYGRIARVIDTFDNLTTHRPDQTALSPFDALMKMCIEQKDYFDRNILKQFVRFFGLKTGGNINLDIWKNMAFNI